MRTRCLVDVPKEYHNHRTTPSGDFMVQHKRGETSPPNYIYLLSEKEPSGSASNFQTSTARAYTAVKAAPDSARRGRASSAYEVFLFGFDISRT